MKPNKYRGELTLKIAIIDISLKNTLKGFYLKKLIK